MATATRGSGRISATSNDNFVVQPADVVFVSAMQCSRVIMERAFSGISSLQELLSVVGKCIDGATGLVTLHLRNRDRGCSAHRAVRYRPSAPVFAMA